MSLIQEALKKANQEKIVSPKIEPETIRFDLEEPSPNSLKIKAIIAGLLIFFSAFFVVQSLIPAKLPIPGNVSSRAFVLSGVTTQGGGQYAIINNQVVGIGKVVDGAVLEEITSHQVTLNLRGKKISLAL
ncbi:MAG: hypothetical protein HYZ85_00015 [Candidatus Omnitrophica bacterium]|nr:hypothetical protein [Candidatus Omnitrophota bacterium]